MRFLRNIGLFIAAPFIALIYVIALPFYGLYMIASTGLEAIGEKNEIMGSSTDTSE